MKNIDNRSKTIEDLRIKLDAAEQENCELKAKLKWYEEQLLLKQKKQFGKSSEHTDSEQLSFFDEAENEELSNVEEPKIETITYKRKKSTGKRAEQLERLPQETIEYRLSEEELLCKCCNGTLHEMKKEIRREIKIIPAQALVINHERFVYSCRQCEKNEIVTPIIKADMPKPPIPNSIASPSSVAFTMSQKYSEGLPLYRQEKYLSGLGIDLSRQTLANWMIYCANTWLKPLYDRMHGHLVEHDILHADETTLQVLHEDGREATNKSYMWLYRTGRFDTPIVLYNYQTTRASKHPNQFLNRFNGYLHTDGYIGYQNIDNVTLVGCWAHARRYFNDALSVRTKETRTTSLPSVGLNFCNKLFQIEREIANLSYEKQFQIRQTRSQEVLDAFEKWLQNIKPLIMKKSLFGKAVMYTLNQWKHLKNFMLDGRLEVSNNKAERSIKPFVVGRKNWLFSNTQKGANASAIIYSVIETAKENGLVPFFYLEHLLSKLPNTDLLKKENIDALLPWSITLPQQCFAPNRSNFTRKV